MRTPTYLLACILLTISWFSAPESQATRIEWELEFVDLENERVGTGAFAYDPATSRCIETSQNPSACSPDPFRPGEFVSGFLVSTVVEEFFATVEGESWGREFFGWWYDPVHDVRAGSQFADRTFLAIRGDWPVGLKPGAAQTPQDDLLLISAFSPAPDGEWIGAWRKIVDLNSPGEIVTSGFWRARIVPEPRTILLVSLGLVGMAGGRQVPRARP